MMNAMSLLFFLIGLVVLASVSVAQDEVAAKLTPSAISARIAELRMGDIIVKTKPVLRFSFSRPGMSFYSVLPLPIRLPRIL